MEQDPDYLPEPVVGATQGQSSWKFGGSLDVPLAGRAMGPRLPSKDAITVAIGVVLANVACRGAALGIVSRYGRESADLGAYKFDDLAIA